MRTSLVTEKANATNQVAVGDAGRTEDHIVATHEIIDFQDALDIAKAHLNRPLRFGLIARLEPSHEVSPKALDRRGGQDALGRAAGSHCNVDAGRLDGGCDARVDVAVGDQTNPSAGRAYVAD